MKIIYKRFTTNPNLKTDFFERIDSPNKAYILGMLYADGNVFPYKSKKNKIISYKIRLRLAIQDEQIVRNISQELLGYDSVSILPRQEKNWQPIACLQIGNKKIGEDLIKLGCHPNKSLSLRIPTYEQVTKEFYRDFIRGFFDGDGYAKDISPIVVSFTSNNVFCNQLKEFLEKEEGICFSEFKHRKNNYGSICMSGKNSCYKFYNYLYKDCDLFMERKRESMKRGIMCTFSKKPDAKKILMEKFPF